MFKNSNIYRIKFITALLALIAVSGCAYMPDNGFSREVFNKPDTLQIRKVALLDVPPPSGIWLGDPSSGVAAGLLGPLAAMGTANHKGSSIIEATAISNSIRDELKSWLEKSGIEVVLLQATRSNKFKMLDGYSQFGAVDADVISEVAPMHVGFKEEIGKVHFTEGDLSPDIALAYRLHSTSSEDVLIESNVYYSSFDYSNWSSWKGPTLLGPKEHIFKDSEAVTQDKDEAIRRLSHAIKGATKYISARVMK